MLDQIEKLCLSHFLCQFNPKSRKRLTAEVVREIALTSFSAEKVNEFIDERLAKFQQMLVEEFNERYRDKRPLRFQIVDAAGIGVIVSGYQRKKLAKETRFQNTLHKISADEFEKMASELEEVEPAVVDEGDAATAEYEAEGSAGPALDEHAALSTATAIDSAASAAPR